MNRQFMAALMRAEIEIYVAATRYIEAASNDVGFNFEATDLRPAVALLDEDPDVLTCGYTTPKLIRAAAGSAVRISILYVLLRAIKLLHPMLKAAKGLRADWMMAAPSEVVILLPLIVVTTTTMAVRFAA